VTTVSRDTKLRARIARRLLGLGGASEVLVFAGEERPWGEKGVFMWHGQEGEGVLAGVEAPRIEAEPAPRAIAGLLHAEALAPHSGWPTIGKSIF